MEYITVACKLVLGCVMVWQDQVVVTGDLPSELPVESPAIVEYCPVDHDGSNNLAVTERMKDLAVAGFRPVALVSCDQDSSGLSIYAREDSSESLRALLGKESEAIFRKAMDHVEKG
jgi:hypothetical protein